MYPHPAGKGATGWRESLEAVVSRTGHLRFLELCDEANPDVAQRDGYRALMVSMAAGGPIQAPAPTAEDLRLRADVARRGCGGCGG